MIIPLTVRLTKNISLYKMGYFPEPHIELDVTNYATKSHLKSAAGISASKFAKTIDFSWLKIRR